MAILHVRNVPAELYERLQRRAEAQRRSLSAEVITLLTWAVEETERSPEATLAGIRERRFFRPEEVGAPDSTAILRQDRGR
jgi:plasmid stability protein